jgi:hypothetical protein
MKKENKIMLISSVLLMLISGIFLFISVNIMELTPVSERIQDISVSVLAISVIIILVTILIPLREK